MSMVNLIYKSFLKFFLAFVKLWNVVIQAGLLEGIEWCGSI